MDLSIIIVNYQTKSLTLKAIDSVIRADKIPGKMEVIVVDNGSHDGTLDAVKRQFPRTITIESNENLGFAGGNNLGLRRARGKYLLLLNSDVVIGQDTLVKMWQYAKENPRVGLTTCRVELPHGSIDPASHRGFPTPWAAFTYFTGLEKLWPKNRWFGQYHLGWKDLSRVHEIDAPAGAFFWLKREALNQAGLLDERFFMYGEDLDLAYRIKKAGWKIMYVPLTTVLHLKGASGMKQPAAKFIRQKTTREFFESMMLFYKKHYAKKYFFPVKWLMFLGINLMKNYRLMKLK